MYKYKGKYYELIKTGMMKHPETRKWIECVVYANEFGQIFVRDWLEFLEKFEKVEV